MSPPAPPEHVELPPDPAAPPEPAAPPAPPEPAAPPAPPEPATPPPPPRPPAPPAPTVMAWLVAKSWPPSLAYKRNSYVPAATAGVVKSHMPEAAGVAPEVCVQVFA